MSFPSYSGSAYEQCKAEEAVDRQSSLTKCISWEVNIKLFGNRGVGLFVGTGVFTIYNGTFNGYGSLSVTTGTYSGPHLDLLAEEEADVCWDVWTSLVYVFSSRRR